jgi:hypothetical protein
MFSTFPALDTAGIGLIDRVLDPCVGVVPCWKL